MMFTDITTDEADLTDPMRLAELEAFYETTLVSQLTCSPYIPAQPTGEWLRARSDTFVPVVRSGGELVGCWIVRDHGIFYPCVKIDYGQEGVVQVFRELALFSFERAGYRLWASTPNSLIHVWAQDMGLEDITFDGVRMEWS